MKTKFDTKGYIENEAMFNKFQNLIDDYNAFGYQELEIEDLDFSKDAIHEYMSWSGNPDDYEPTYSNKIEKEEMDTYSTYKLPTHQDICEYFGKEPYEITKEILDNIDEEDFKEYLEDKYYEDLYEEAYNTFYNEEE